MKKYSLIEKLYIYSSIPFSLIHVTIKFFSAPKERNPFHNGKKLTGIKNAAISKDISVAAVKEKCK
jgi:hypothetical protein